MKRTFIDMVGEYLIDIGATERCKEMRTHIREFDLATPLGNLWIAPNISIIKRKKYFTVFMRFDDVERAKAVMRDSINPFTGKYNHHYGPGQDEAWCLELLRGTVSHILSLEPKQ